MSGLYQGHKQPATRFATRFLLGVARCLALVWLAPALLFNVDWTGHGTWQANTAAVFMILGSALFIEGALRLRSWVLTPVCILAAFFLGYVNTKQATRVLSLAGEAEREAKLATLAEGSHLGSQGSQWVAKRKVQVELAGEKTVGTLEGELQALQLSDLRAWNATSECKDVTVRASAVFCTEVAKTKAKIAAAKERDELDKKIAALPVPKVIVTPGAEAPVVDPYVTNVVALLKEAGFAPSERLIKAEEAMARALGFELLAALGPTCWLAFVNILAGGITPPPARTRKAAAKPERSALDAPAMPESADDYDRCVADLFEAEPAGTMFSKAIRPLVKTWFETKGVKLDEDKLWAKMRAKFTYDRNNNRPRYLGLKVRVKGPPRLALVSTAQA